MEIFLGLLAILFIGGAINGSIEKKKQQAYINRINSDPIFRLQEKYKSCSIEYNPTYWKKGMTAEEFEAINRKYPVTEERHLNKIRESFKPKSEIRLMNYDRKECLWEGNLSDSFFQEILLALKPIGIEVRKCPECGSLRLGHEYPNRGEFCSDRCYTRCFERDLRHNGRSRTVPPSTIPLFELIEKQGYVCAICGGRFDQYWYENEDNYLYHSVDHIVPVDRGGKHVLGNVQVVHMLCNEIKSTGPNIKLTVKVDEFLKENSTLTLFKDDLHKKLKDKKINLTSRST